MKRNDYTGKERRTYKNANSVLWNPVPTTLKCEYCGSPMILKPASFVNVKYDQMVYACTNYPECDCYCRVKENKGKYLLVSTPADRTLRSMRNEAHFYMDLILKNRIFNNMGDLYEVLAAKSSIGGGYVKHIGECREYGCKEIANFCIDILYQNMERLTVYEEWRNPKCLNDESLNKAKELKKRVKKGKV